MLSIFHTPGNLEFHFRVCELIIVSPVISLKQILISSGVIWGFSLYFEESNLTNALKKMEAYLSEPIFLSGERNNLKNVFDEKY